MLQQAGKKAVELFCSTAKIDLTPVDRQFEAMRVEFKKELDVQNAKIGELINAQFILKSSLDNLIHNLAPAIVESYKKDYARKRPRTIKTGSGKY